MADLKRVRFKGGGEGSVSPAWIERWPDDIEAVLEDTTTADDTAAPDHEGDSPDTGETANDTPDSGESDTTGKNRSKK